MAGLLQSPPIATRVFQNPLNLPELCDWELVDCAGVHLRGSSA